MKLRPPSPALAVSIVAVVIACTGSAVAATVITGKQIRNGTVSGADIKDGSLLSKELSKGSQNLLRDKGGRIAYEAIRKSGPEGVPANVITRVATLKVPGGAYSVQANMVMTAFAGPTNPLEALLGANGSLGGTCSLNAAGPTHSSTGTIVVNDRQTPTTFSMQLTRTVGGPSEFFLECSANAPWRASETSIIATSVGSVSLTEVTG